MHVNTSLALQILVILSSVAFLHNHQLPLICLLTLPILLTHLPRLPPPVVPPQATTPALQLVFLSLNLVLPDALGVVLLARLVGLLVVGDLGKFVNFVDVLLQLLLF